jgi:hypothetical protein
MTTATLNRTTAERIAARLRRCGWACTGSDVLEVWSYGTHDNAALASAILQAFSTLELTP